MEDILGLIFTAAIIFLYVIVLYYDRRKCTEKVTALCTRNTSTIVYPSRAHHDVYFKYEYQSIAYEGVPVDTFFKKTKEFVEGGSYTIYVNPHNPKEFKCDTPHLKRIDTLIAWIMLFFKGILALIIGAFILNRIWLLFYR